MKICLFFLLVLFCGQQIMAQTASQRDSLKNRVYTSLQTRLGLSSRQMSSLDSLDRENLRRINETNKQQITAAQRKAQKIEVYKQMSKAIQSILTPGQWEQYEQDRKERQTDLKAKNKSVSDQILVP